MEIRFISSLTAEDEDMFAPAVLKAVSALLDQLPIAYTMRIETAGAQVYQHTRLAAEVEHADAENIARCVLTSPALSKDHRKIES